MVLQKQATKQRVRLTNKALEARQFSTVRLPRRAEVQAPQVDVERMYEDRRSVHADRSESAAPAFDPIPNDPLFVVVAKSKYWPPPPLEELQATSGVAVSDGFDTYDRREDDRVARKERVKVVRGELNHPRGKPRQNTLVKLSDSDDDDSSDSGGAEE